MFSLVVQPEIKSAENLKGKIIAISSFGGTQHLVTAGTLRAVGIDPDREVKMINVGNEAVRVEQLRSKQIHAAMINPPMSVMMKKEGFGLLLHDADTIIVFSWLLQASLSCSILVVLSRSNLSRSHCRYGGL